MGRGLHGRLLARLARNNRFWLVGPVAEGALGKKARFSRPAFSLAALLCCALSGAWAQVQFPQVLAYHQVAAAGEAPLPDYPVISLDLLEAQFRYLAEHNIRTLTLDEYLQAIAQPNPPRRAVLLTFDDGYRSLLTRVYPLLQKYDLHAVAFVIASRVGQKNRLNPAQPWLSWSECRALEQSGRVDIEAHGYRSHSKVLGLRAGLPREGPFLTTRLYDPERKTLESEEAYRRRILNDLLLSRTVIEANLKKRVKAFAWPYGKTCPEALAAAREAGYLVTFGLETGEFGPLNRARFHSPEHWDEVIARIESSSPFAPPELSFARALGAGPVPLSLRVAVIALAMLAGAVVWLAFYLLALHGHDESR